MQRGFTLLELLVSLSITLVIGAAVFQLFQQNERVFYDQNLVTEMQQGARAAIHQAADEIRMAGQGVPIFADSFGETPSEESVAILSGSNATRIHFRAGLAPTATYVVAPTPTVFSVGAPVTVVVDDATEVYDAVGGSPVGRFVYFWGAAEADRWNWVRASIRSVSPSSGGMDVTVTSTGPMGAGDNTVVFPASSSMALEEAIALYFDSSSNSMRRTTATSMMDPTHPTWAPANELVANVTQLRFDYFDAANNSVIPDSLANRSRIARVDIHLAVRTARELRNHTRPAYAISLRMNIRNARMH
jgi:prepilin-type N-terminal cleavage/methylation domain-containing protein